MSFPPFTHTVSLVKSSEINPAQVRIDRNTTSCLVADLPDVVYSSSRASVRIPKVFQPEGRHWGRQEFQLRNTETIDAAHSRTAARLPPTMHPSPVRAADNEKRKAKAVVGGARKR